MDYKKYRMKATELVMLVVTGLIIDGVVSYVFYRSIIAFLVFLPCIILIVIYGKKEIIKKKKKELSHQFREAILAVSTSLNAGYSIENSFIEAAKDMKTMYGKNAIITKELNLISRKLSANEVLEEILDDFAKRSMVDDIQDFSDVFIIAKRSGGDMNAIIKRTVLHISDKIEVEREIDTLMSAKKMEQNIMNIIPILIVIYLDFSSPGFLDALYHNFIGIAIMTSCLLMYIFAYYLSQRIINVEV